MREDPADEERAIRRGRDVRRPAEGKAAYDPENVFRIAPAA
ncbi:hypothetical protein [Streptomyces sp. NPDC088757]